MKAIILAAGIGRRLLPLTEKIPKSLLKIDERTIIEHQIQSLRNCGIDDIVIVTGYGEDEVKKICGLEITYVYNKLYQLTNNIYSLWLAKDCALNGFLLLNGDDIFHKEILRNLIASKFEDCLVVDNYKVLGEEEMKVKMNSGIIYEINKTMEPSKADGEYIGLAKFSDRGAKILFKEIEKFTEKKKTDVWYENAFQEMMRYYKLVGVSTNRLPWIEIDDFKDLEKARKEIYPRIKNGD